MKTNKKHLHVASGISIFGLLTLVSLSCGKGLNPDEKNTSETDGSSFTLTAYAAACGPLEGSTLSAYSVAEDGTKSLIGNSTVKAGAGKLTITAQSRPVLLEVTGGTCLDMTAGQTVELGESFVMGAMLPSVSANQKIAVSPFSQIAVDYTSTAKGSTLAERVTASNKSISVSAGVADILNVTTSFTGKPEDTKSDDAKLGVLIAGLSQFANNLGVKVTDLIESLRSDFKVDGKFDGLANGKELSIGTSGQLLPWDAWTTGIPEAIKTFLASNRNPGFTTESTPTTKSSETSTNTSSDAVRMVLTSVDGDGDSGLNFDTGKAASRMGDLARTMVACNGALYVTWNEPNANNLNSIRLSKYDGTSWTRIDGAASALSGLNSDSTLAAGGTSLQCFKSKLYLAQMQLVTGAKYNIRVKSFDGTTWTDADGGADITDGVGAGNGQLALIYFASKLYVIYTELGTSTTENKVRVKSYDGTSWTFADGGTSIKRTSDSTIGSNYSCTVYKGNLYCNWAEATSGTFNSQCAVVVKFDGISWTNNDGGSSSSCPIHVGTIAAEMSVVRQALVSSPNGNMYYFWDQNDTAIGGLRKYLRWFNGTTWSTEYTKFQRVADSKTWYPEMMIHGSYLYTVWTEGANPSAPLHLARTLDGKTIEYCDGSTETTPTGINHVKANGASMPSMAVLGPNVYIAWIEAGSNGSPNQLRVSSYGPEKK